MRPPPPTAWTPPVARYQSDLFTVRQALDAGMTPAQVRHRRRVGAWVRFAGAALRHRDRAPGPWAEADAIALTWPDAVACLGSAAKVHGLPLDRTTPVTAWVPHARGTRHGLVPVQYQLPAEDVIRTPTFAVTTPVRTVFDAMGRLPAPAAEGLLIWALTRRVVSHEELAAILARSPGLAGNRRRRRLLARCATGAMSVAEHRLHAILRRAGITGWVAGETLRDDLGVVGAADVLFPDVGLVLEVDGAAYHGAARFQVDRTRQNRLVAAGYTVLRFTWEDLTRRPDEVARQVSAMLARLRRGDPQRFRSR